MQFLLVGVSPSMNKSLLTFERHSSRCLGCKIACQHDDPYWPKTLRVTICSYGCSVMQWMASRGYSASVHIFLDLSAHQSHVVGIMPGPPFLSQLLKEPGTQYYSAEWLVRVWPISNHYLRTDRLVPKRLRHSAPWSNWPALVQLCWSCLLT